MAHTLHVEELYGLDYTHAYHLQNINNYAKELTGQNVELSRTTLEIYLKAGMSLEVEELNEAILKLPKKNRMQILEDIFEDNPISAIVLSKLYTKPEVKLVNIVMEYLVNSNIPDIATFLGTYDLNCMALVNVMNAFGREVDYDFSEIGVHRAIDLHNMAFLMGCGVDSRNLICDDCYPISDSDSEVRQSKSRILSELYKRDEGRWWNTYAFSTNIEKEKVAQLVKDAIVLCITSTDDSGNHFRPTGVVALLVVFLLAMGRSKLLGLNNMEVTRVIDDIMTHEELRCHRVVMKSTRLDFASSAHTWRGKSNASFVPYVPYDRKFRESVRLFKTLDWILQPQDMNPDCILRCMELYCMMPMVSNEMLPSVAKVLYAYFICCPTESYSIGDVQKIDRILHGRECILGLLLYGAREMPHFRNNTTAVDLRLLEIMTFVGSNDYVLCDTILGTDIVLYHMCFMYSIKDSFVYNHIYSLIYKLSPWTIKWVKNSKLMNSKLLNDTLKNIIDRNSSSVSTVQS